MPNSQFSSEFSGDFWSSSGFCHESPLQSNNHHYIPTELMEMEDMQFDNFTAAYHLLEKSAASSDEDPHYSDKTLESEISKLLCLNGMKRSMSFPYFEMLSNQVDHLSPDETDLIHDTVRELSTEEVMRIAAAGYIQSSAGEEQALELTCAGFDDEEIKKVKLASLFLAAANKASNREYEQSRNLLRQCQASSCRTGNTVQRVVHYFSEALQARIDRETGVVDLGHRTKSTTLPGVEVIRAMLTSNPLQLVTHRKLPFSQLLQFTSVQTILENLDLAPRIHIIDLSIKHGVQWTILIQALATRSASLDYLKISAVGVLREAIAETGKQLLDFAESSGVTLDYKSVIVSDMKQLRADMFHILLDEAVAIYSAFDVNTMIIQPECLENLMKVIWKIKPGIMTVVDVESNHNSPAFNKRFLESLLYFSTFFDCLDECMDRDDEYRMILEGNNLAQGIRSIVAMEGKERVVRHVGIGVWRMFFARYGMEEVELSEWSQYQASLLMKQFPDQGKSCKLGKNGKSLTIEWKGTPLHFISAWRFSQCLL